jgi:hypothetical protein
MTFNHQLKQKDNNPKRNTYTSDVTGKAFGPFPEIEKQKYNTSKAGKIDKVGIGKNNELIIHVLQGNQNNQTVQSGNAVDTIHKVVGVQNTHKKDIRYDY